VGREGCFGIIGNVSSNIRAIANVRMSSESLAANGESLVSFPSP
jgi:hypothetical protein